MSSNGDKSESKETVQIDKDTIQQEELDETKQETKDENYDETNLEQEATGGARPKTYTEKGRLYNEEQIDKHFNNLKSFSLKINRMIADKEQHERVRSRYSDWMYSYEKFLDSHQRHVKYVSKQDMENYIHLHDQRETFLLNFKTGVHDYLNSRPDIDMHPNRQTSVGNKSSKSVTSSILSSKKLEAQEKMIELEAMKQRLKRKKELKMAKLAIQLEEEELKIETDIAVADAKAKVYNKLEHGETDIKPVEVKVKHETNQTYHEQNQETFVRADKLDSKVEDIVPAKVKHENVKTKYDLDFAKLPPVKHETLSKSKQQNFEVSTIQNDIRPPFHTRNVSIEDTMGHTQSAIQTMVQHLRKPTPEIKKFSGSPLEFRKFLRQFQAKVVSNCDNDDEKMNYLEQLTFGEANKVVSGYSHLPGEMAYKAAMKQLEERYGDIDVIATAFIKRALEWSTIRNGDSKSLDEFSLFLIECLNGTDSLQAGNVLEYSENIRRLMSKLPFYLHDRWRNIVMRIKDSHKTVRFKDFVDFVKAEARKANDPTYGNATVSLSQQNLKNHDKNHQRVHQKPGMSHAAYEVPKPQHQNVYCYYCETQTHTLDSCKRILSLSREDRITLLKGKGLCFGCLKKGHMSKQCKNRQKCAACFRQHPTILHNWNQTKPTFSLTQASSNNHSNKEATDVQPDNKEAVQASVCSSSTGGLEGAGDVSCAMAIIPVRVKLKNKSQSIETYAFFDSGSSISFCTENLIRQLGTSGKKTQITINTMGNSKTLNTCSINGLQVSGLSMDHIIDLPNVFTMKEIPVSNQHIPTEQEIKNWSHLASIDVPNIDSDVGIMIGNNIPDAYSPLDLATGPSGSPHATETRLGWIVWNVVRDSTSFEVNQVCEGGNETQLNILMQSINMDFPEHLIEDKRENSVEDQLFMEQVQKSIHLENNHYTIALPFRNENIVFPNNANQCIQRLNYLKSKFVKNPQFKKTILILWTR